MVQVTQTEGATDLLTTVGSYLPDADVDLVRRAIDFAGTAHGPQMRASGEPYVTHPIAAARTLADLHLDSQCIAAALLHDVVEDTAVDLEDIEKAFGREVATLVDGVTKLDRLQLMPGAQRTSATKEAEQAE